LIFSILTKMSSSLLWVEYESSSTENICVESVSTEACVTVEDFLKKIQNETSSFDIPKNVIIALYGPSDVVAICPTESLSNLISGNSQDNPLRIQVLTSLPVSAESTSNAKLTSFWNSLRKISKTHDGFLHFPIIPEFFPKHMKSLYVRKAYEVFFNAVYKETKPTGSRRRLNNMAITGMLGVGKSVFLFYVLWRLANIKTTKTVILQRQQDDGCIYVFRNDGCWRTDDSDDRANDFLDEESSWWLTDDVLPAPGLSSATTFLVSPPIREYYSSFLKNQPALPEHYLPVWSLEELKLVAPYYSKSPKEIEDRFDKIGGLALYVLGDHEDLESAIKYAACQYEMTESGGIYGYDLTDSDYLGNLLMHFNVSPKYLDYSFMFPSRYVADMALKVFLVYQPEQLRKLFLRQESPFSAELRASLLEVYTHRLISAGGKFIRRSLDDGTTFELVIPQREIKEFRDFSECIDEDVFYMPKRLDQSCVCSTIVNMGSIPMKRVTRYYGTSANQMERVTEATMGMMNEFYFLVPDQYFKHFEKQKLIRKKIGPRNDRGEQGESSTFESKYMTATQIETVEERTPTEESNPSNSTTTDNNSDLDNNDNFNNDIDPNNDDNSEKESDSNGNEEEGQRIIVDTETDETLPVDCLRQYAICIPIGEDWDNLRLIVESTYKVAKKAIEGKADRRML
jgi:hypothetical protein